MTPEPDRRHMRRALDLARQGLGLTSPNPAVGAVVVRDGEVVGEGFHERAGAPHAEVVALGVAGPRAAGATLYVTLEPCIHHGKTPPCSEAILQAGIRRVVVAIRDPNPLVDGHGIERLHEAGLEVEIGVEAAAAALLNRAFFKFITTGRPHVTLKIAMTLDGKIAARDGSSRWITGEAARAEVHRMRSQVDAILVGIGTLLADDPSLTVRLGRAWPREPLRVVVDSHLRTPPNAGVIRAGRPERVLIACRESPPAERLEPLEAQGVEVLRLPASEGRVDLNALMSALAERQIVSVLAEGGSELNAGLLDHGCVDHLACFMAPLLLGGQGAPSALGGPGRLLKEAFRLRNVTCDRIGEDFLFEGDIEA